MPAASSYFRSSFLKISERFTAQQSLATGFRFLTHLPAYLNNPLTISEARKILDQRLERREEDFLQLLRIAVIENPVSPYRELLSHAGCEYGDVCLMVEQEGLEGALEKLFHAGVYLTTDEYKGRRPAVRGSATINVDPELLRNPMVVPQFYARTSGSRGAATPVPFNMDGTRDHAVNMALSLAARGGANWRKAIWELSGIGPLLWYSVFGGPVDRWFTKVDPKTAGISRWHPWKVRAMTTTGRLCGVSMPSTEHVPVDAPLPIVQWMEQTLKEGEIPHLWTSTSAAVRLCQAAEQAGTMLEGAQLTVTGEPVTEARLAAIQRVGANAVPDYGCVDSGGSISCACLSPEAPDDVHVFSDLNAVIQADAPPFPGDALLLTSIRPSVPFVFLNVSMGDCASLNTRRCGCAVEALGWSTHLHTIRSFEKLTIGGMTFMDTDVVQILDEKLPHRFGGGPSDYQVAEEFAQDGHPRLRLLVHPRVGPLDPATVSDVFLDELGAGSEANRLMVCQLRDEQFLEVERKAPYMTSSGKILHLWTTLNPHPGDLE